MVKDKSRWDVENLDIKFTPASKPVKKPKTTGKTKSKKA